MFRVQAEQRKDGELSQIINYLEGKSLPKDAAEAKKTVIAANQGYFLVEGILYYESSDSPGRRRLVVPQHLWKDMIQYMQDISAKKLIQKLSLVYHWPGMRGYVYQKCASCVTCASTQGQGRRTRPPLHSIPVHGQFYCIEMDYKEMDLSRRGNRYALVFAVEDRKATTVAHCLADFIWRHGIPVKIIHDWGADFLLMFYKRLLKS